MPGMGVPRIIHQMAPSFDSLTPDLKANVARLQSMNPGWDYRFYDHAAARAYIGKWLKPKHLELVDRVNPRYGVVLCDILRHLAMFREGGVYLDIKSGVDRPLEEILRPDDHFLVSQWANREPGDFYGWGLHHELSHIPGGEYQQWYLMGRPRHPFPLATLQRAFANMARYDAGRDGTGFLGTLRLAGPICYSLAIAPLLDTAPHRRIDSAASGLRFTVYPVGEHHARNPGHYSTLDEPLMLPERST
jgi:hypothetical protein